jgi:two-component system sensor histidine kinase HydH
MFTKIKKMSTWTVVPPWVFIGAALILLPIFTVSTVLSINRQKEKSRQLLLEKGAALIRSFEAGTRTGMMSMRRGGFRLQHLLTETAQQPDIVYLFVTDIGGNILVHNDLGLVGSIYDDELDLEKIARHKTLRWRQVAKPNGIQIFEVFQKFQPAGPPKGMMRRHMMMGHRSEAEQQEIEQLFLSEIPKIIFIGLDMRAIEARHHYGHHITFSRAFRNHASIYDSEFSLNKNLPIPHQGIFRQSSGEYAHRTDCIG